MTDACDLAILDHLLGAPPGAPPAVPTFAEWKRAWVPIASRWPTPVDRALAGGLAADRPAWAFAAGYQAAIHCLPGAGTSSIAAVCITETGGPHPARINSRLTPDPGAPDLWRLDGTKTFVSGAQGADRLWVAASTGKTPEGRNRLRMVRGPAGPPGVEITPLPPLAMVAEMPHARVRFASVPVPEASVLPGDGYLRAVKPFRTLEDLHVTAAFLAWLLGVGRRADWPADRLAAVVSLVVSTRSLAQAPSLAPRVHIALGGLLDRFHDLLAQLEPLWPQADAAARTQWERDRGLLEIAEAARRKRLAAAWRHYGG